MWISVDFKTMEKYYFLMGIGITRDIIVYSGVTYPFNGAFIENIIRVDKYSIDEESNEGKYSTDYYTNTH